MKVLATYIFLVFGTLSGWAQSQQTRLKKLLERDVPCIFDGPVVSLSDTGLYAANRNVSYSYSYVYPKYFRETWPTEGVVSEVRKTTNAYIDTVTYTSTDHKAVFKIYAGDVVPFPLGQVNRTLKATDIAAVEKAVDDHIKLIRMGKDKELGRVKITSLCKGIKGYNYSICVTAYRAGQQYIYKVILAEMPVSGELIFSHFLYQYPTALKDKYQALGTTLANQFKADE